MVSILQIRIDLGLVYTLWRIWAGVARAPEEPKNTEVSKFGGHRSTLIITFKHWTPGISFFSIIPLAFKTTV